jgi:glycosyltransferase involved in cell wall biosynthesis
VPDPPILSVLVPSLNSGDYLCAALESVLTDCPVPVEVIVQDGQSTDGTQALLAGVGDPRVLHRSEPDTGQADALNRALARTQGEWVLWLNADDELAPGALASIASLLDDPDLAVITGDFAVIDIHGGVRKHYTSKPLDSTRLFRHGNYIFSGTIFIRRLLLQKLGGLDASLHFAMDYDLLHRLAASGVKAHHVNRTLANFRQQPGSKTSKHGWRMLREHWTVARRHGAMEPRNFPAAITDIARTALYVLTRRIWLSNSWVKLRPAKRLGV